MWLWAGAYFLLVNLVAVAAFAFDKRRAETGGWRVPERTLLQIAAVGGTPGAMAAQQILRHKTRKEPFRTRLWIIWLVQASVVVLFAFRGPLSDLVIRGLR